MSWQLTSDVKQNMRGEEPAVKLLAMCLADYANPHGDDIFPSVALLAEHVGVSERTVQRHMTRLIEIGFITLVGNSRGGSMRRGAENKRRGRTNRYRINAEWWKPSPDKLTGHGADTPTNERVTPTPVTRYPDTAVSPEDSIEDSISGKALEDSSSTPGPHADDAIAKLKALSNAIRARQAARPSG